MIRFTPSITARVCILLMLIPALSASVESGLFHSSFEANEIFQFSSFQTERQFRGTDFPEISHFDFATDFVFLKLYIHPTRSPSGEEDVLFLGQVIRLENLTITVSLPLGIDQLNYDLYGTAQGFSGVIVLDGGS